MRQVRFNHCAGFFWHSETSLTRRHGHDHLLPGAREVNCHLWSRSSPTERILLEVSTFAPSIQWLLDPTRKACQYMLGGLVTKPDLTAFKAAADIEVTW